MKWPRLRSEHGYAPVPSFSDTIIGINSVWPRPLVRTARRCSGQLRGLGRLAVLCLERSRRILNSFVSASGHPMREIGCLERSGV